MMPERHLDRESLVLLVGGTLPAAERRRVISHLLRGCTSCKQLTSGLWLEAERGLRAARQPGEEAGNEQVAAYRAAVDRGLGGAENLAIRLAQERRDAAQLVEELAQHPVPRQLTLAANRHRFQTRGLCELLIERSYAARFDDPRRTLDLARLGAQVADHLDAAVYGRATLNDLRARARAHVGNALRVLGELAAADQEFAVVPGLLKQGTGDPLERAELHAFRAELRRAQRRFDEAVRLYDRAIRLFLRFGAPQQAAIWLIGKAITQGFAGETEAAITTLRQALARLDPGADLRMTVAARHNLAWFLIDAARVREAQQEFEQLQPLYRRIGDRMLQARVGWLKGKLLIALERQEEAERVLLGVREVYVQAAMAYNAALVSLELATAYSRAGRTDAMKRLAAEMHPIFRSIGVHREAMAALLVFQQAAEIEAVSIGLIKELAAYFEKASKNPALPFRPAS